MSTDVYVPEHGWQLHMSWCPRDHEGGDCVLEEYVYDAPNDATALVSLTGIHCSHQRLEVSGFVTTDVGTRDLLQQVTSAECLRIGALADVECDHHPHLHPEEL